MPDAAAPSPRRWQWLGASGVTLSALSFAIVFYTASEEPFVALRWSELSLIFGLGAPVFALFVVWAAACVRSFRHAGRMAPLCASVLWAAINLLYLGESIYSYAEDLANPDFGPLRERTPHAAKRLSAD